MIFDMHVHTRISQCSSLSLDEILQNADQKGLDGVCITDHQSTVASRQIRRGVQANGLRVFVGMEYHTADGDFLIFGIPPDLPEGLDARDMLQRVKQNGGAAIAAHPFRQNNHVSESLIRDGLCGIVESVNGRNKTWENQQVALWRKRYSLIECGGSDAHCLSELGKIKTRFDIPINTQADLIFALNNGLCAPEMPAAVCQAA